MSEWGWNPETFSAIGTVGATLVGGIALLFASLQLRMASRQLRMAGQDLELKAQARLMHVRIVRDSRSPLMYAATTQKSLTDGHWIEWVNSKGTPGSYEIDLELANDSQSDIRLVALVCVGDYPLDGEGKHSSNVETGGWFGGVRFTFGFAQNVMPPGSKYFLRIPFAPGFIKAGELVGVTFVDAQGQLWTRRLDGVVTRGQMKMIRGYPRNDLHVA